MEAIPPPLTTLDAGTVWRLGKLNAFIQRARQLGMQNDPACSAALDTIATLTDQLEALSNAERSGERQSPWWADGEYSAADADAANDKGVRLAATRDYSGAYTHFTEAVRLAPDRAAYHANRAAAALQLRNFAGAMEDAEHAVRLSPTHVQSRLRAAKAYMALVNPENALRHYESILVQQPDHREAQLGREAASQLLNQARQTRDQEAQSAANGERAALPCEPLSDDAAAEQLLAAEHMHRLHPTRESVKCARVEALIQCQRCQEALDACKTLMPHSIDAAYLTAEALWRLGRLDDAMAALRCVDYHSRSTKCAELLDFVSQMKDTVENVERIEAGDDAVAQLNQLLACKRVAGTRMHAELLRHRAALVTDHRSAIVDLDAALRIDPENVRCLALRAELYDFCGDAERCFLDLRRGEMLAAQQGGGHSAAELRAAAKRALGHRAIGGRGAPAAHHAPTGLPERPPPRSYQVLGLKISATQREITHAYRMLAGKWHPDKWASTPEKQQIAAQRFRIICEAYDTLRDPVARERVQQAWASG